MDNVKLAFLLIFFSFILMFSGNIIAQVVQTQVIDLSERARDFFIEATKGNIQGQETFDINGHNEDLGTIEEDIQEQGGVLIFLEAAEIMSVVSTSASDTIAGVGARSVLVTGLDENFSLISEVVNLSGLTSVNTTQEYIRINDFRVQDVGLYGNTNVGDIIATSFFQVTVQMFIESTEGIAHTTHYTVPKGTNIIITGITVSVSTGKTVKTHFHTRNNADDTVVPVSPINIVKDLHGVAGTAQVMSTGNLRFDEMTDVWFSGQTSSGASSDLEVNYDFVQYAIGT